MPWNDELPISQPVLVVHKAPPLKAQFSENRRRRRSETDAEESEEDEMLVNERWQEAARLSVMTVLRSLTCNTMAAQSKRKKDEDFSGGEGDAAYPAIKR